MPDQVSASAIALEVQPGRVVRVSPGSSILDGLRIADTVVSSICGGIGVCCDCKVVVLKGSVSEPTDAEESGLEDESLANGVRLACQTRLLGDTVVSIPEESLPAEQRIQLEGQIRGSRFAPTVEVLELAIKPPASGDALDALSRVQSAATRATGERVNVPPDLIPAISEVVKVSSGVLRVAVSGRNGDRVVLGVAKDHAPLGMAVDLGTTKIAVYLVDLTTGRTVAEAGETNPQSNFGEDVVSRIAYANRGDESRAELRAVVVAALNRMVERLCDQIGASPADVLDGVVVGNTAMHHLFTGLAVRQLGEAPYVPVAVEALDLPARELGLHGAAGAAVHLLPNIAGYVGGDHVAMLLASIEDSEATSLYVDIGTNTEISLVADGRCLTCSCASGPAFEGRHILHGMRASEGAVERVEFVEDRYRYEVVGNGAARGICGSGILDVVAAMRKSGAIDTMGRIQKGAPGVRDDGWPPVLVLVPAEAARAGTEVTVCQRDVREVQLAKAAIRAGIEILMNEMSLLPGDIDQVILAGAFGTYLRYRSAIRIGMLPAVPESRSRQIGNAAGTGARLALISRAARHEAADIAHRAEYIELTTHAGFKDAFLDSMALASDRDLDDARKNEHDPSGQHG
jgi:uncharacterized 2Fe-2S/4Fe-4S cluster protein (DUF4445 family)